MDKENQELATIESFAGMALEQATAIQGILTQTVPDYAIEQRPGRGGKTFSYVKHGWVTEQLNLAFKWNWSGEAMWDTLKIEQDKGVLIFYRLTVNMPDRPPIVNVEAGWKEWVKGMDLGHMIQSAISNGLKRCAMRLGLGLSLYNDTDERTAEEVCESLYVFAQNKDNWTRDQLMGWLRANNFTPENIVEQSNQAYTKLASAIKAKQRAEENETEIVIEPEDNVTTVSISVSDDTEIADADHYEIAAILTVLSGSIVTENDVRAILHFRPDVKTFGQLKEKYQALQVRATPALVEGLGKSINIPSTEFEKAAGVPLDKVNMPLGLMLTRIWEATYAAP
jgi:hypothetical protein